MKQIKGLDTLRAFAVFFVIIAHFGVWFDDTSPSGRFITIVLIPSGRFGVDLFFVLSGFLITSILLNAKNKERANRFFIVRNFFIRRALRIFPIYYLLLFFLFFINYPDVRRYFWYFATYTSNLLPYKTNSWNMYCHTWTLAIEEQFYLLWPWLIIFVNNKYLKALLLAVLLIGVVSTYIGMSVQGHMEPFLVFNSFDAFGIGGLYALARLNDKESRKFEISMKVLVVPALCMCFYWKMATMNNSPMPAVFLTKTCNSVIAIWLIIVVINNKSQWIRRYLLESKVLNYIGKISYGIYLYHFPYIGFFCGRVNSFLFNATAKYPRLQKTIHDHHVDYWIQVSIIILIAALSYKLIEKPLLNFKKRFSYLAPER